MTIKSQVVFIFWIGFFVNIMVFAQRPAYPTGRFEADWISHPYDTLTSYGVYHFRKTFNLRQKPGSFYIHVSADHRYRLFVNGKPVCYGPARGDFNNWFYETLDIGPWLSNGDNVLAAQVWNMGENRPQAQLTIQTAFVLQGDGPDEEVVNTDTSWRVIRNKAYFPLPFPRGGRAKSYTGGDCDSVVFSGYPFGWEAVRYDDRDWLPVKIETDPRERLYYYARNLKPRPIPLMEETPQPIEKIARSSGIPDIGNRYVGGQKIVIPAYTTASVLFDQTYLTIGYPEIRFSKGKNSEVKVSYAEGLYDSKERKGHRDEIDGRGMMDRGIFDFFRPDGGDNRLFRPLWLRTYRYLQVDVETEGDPLTIEGLRSVFSAYPFRQNGSFASSDPALDSIWKVGWHTIRVGSLETFVDGPYYEQLQYGGDSRIQAMISLYGSGDDRLMRNAIDQFNWSRSYEGLTMDSYPRFFVKIIPTYSLAWIGMIHDYYMYRDDPAFIKRYLIGISGVLDWFESRLNEKMLLGPLEYWNFVDWSRDFSHGVPPGGVTGNSALMSLVFVQALDEAAELLESFGKRELPAHYRALSSKIKQAVVTHCFDPVTGFISDTPEKIHFSQHTQIMALLTGCVAGREPQQSLIEKTLKDDRLSPVSLYFRYFLNRALVKAGLGNEYLNTISVWKDMIANGLTTFPETGSANPRSDCHGWSASPTFDFLSIVCGINPASPGFKSVVIRPHMGYLSHIQGVVPHPKGKIEVKLKKNRDGSLSGEVTLPDGLPGKLEYNGKSFQLHKGKQEITI